MIIFVTGNLNKASELEKHTNIKVTHKALDIPEIQSLDPIEIVTHKVKTAYGIVKVPVVVEDTSLTFDALGKLPGPLIKWFLQELHNDGLCRILNSYTNREACATIYFAYYDGAHLKIFSAEKKGTIAPLPRGSNGFGWDAIFIPHDSNKTWAEDDNPHPIRQQAAQKLERYLLNKNNEFRTSESK